MTASLRLHVASTFFSRLTGLHGLGPLAHDEGLVLMPCASIHTFFLRQPIDVVFLDGKGRELRRVLALPPFRVAGAWGACCAIELPARYCEHHPDYLERIHAALRI